MDKIWTICEMIVTIFELTAFAIMTIGIIGFLEGGKYDNPIMQKIYNILFCIDD